MIKTLIKILIQLFSHIFQHSGPKMNRFMIYIGLVVSMLIWAITFVWVKQIMDAGLSPTMLIFFRLLITSIIVLPLFALLRYFKQIQRKDWPMLLLMSLLEPFLYYLGETNGIKLVSPNIAAIIIATIPVFLTVFARVILGEKLKIINYFGIVVSFAGVICIILDGDGRLSASPRGLIFLFLAVFSAVGYTLIAKKLLLRYNPFLIAGIKILIACVYYIPIFLIFDLPDISKIQFTLEILLLILALGICGNLLAYLFFNTAIKHIGASKSSIFSNLIPVFTIVFSFFILSESVDIIKATGILLTLLGIYISQLQRNKNKT